jgi:hypothetical protein
MITQDTWIEEILEKYPKAQQFLSEKGIVCVMCGEPVWGTLGDQMKEKGLRDSEQEELVRALNKYLGIEYQNL